LFAALLDALAVALVVVESVDVTNLTSLRRSADLLTHLVTQWEAACDKRGVVHFALRFRSLGLCPIEMGSAVVASLLVLAASMRRLLHSWSATESRLSGHIVPDLVSADELLSARVDAVRSSIALNPGPWVGNHERVFHELVVSSGGRNGNVPRSVFGDLHAAVSSCHAQVCAFVDSS
jgi:hypothetical protein